MREEYGKLNRTEMSIWECCELLNEFVDESDPDLDEPQIEHLLQTAEAIRKDYPDEDWLHLTGLIHDLGKVLLHSSFGELPQWAVVGDTYPVGCAFDESIVHHKYFKENPDFNNPSYNTKYGIYTEGCGLDNVFMSWGHDDYMYLVAKENKTTLPSAGLFIIRYHSFYALHKSEAYKHLMNEEDRENMKWLKVFNKYDLYSKSKVRINVEEVKPYYLSLINKAVRLLLECRLVKRNDVNGDGLTFLDILRRNQERREEAGGSQGSGEEENLDLEQVVVNTGCKEAASVPRSKAQYEIYKSPLTFWTFCSTFMRRLRSNTSDEARAVFLIVCTLIITATYQTALQPPGGVHQPEEDANAGSVVMKQTFFILLWVSNTVGFCYAILYTFCLMPIGSMFACWFFWIGGSLCISYALAMAVISPHPLVFISMTFAFFLLFALYLLSKIFFDNWRKHLTVGLVPQLSWRGKV
ncbi:hypothetical protein F2Q68_00013392 [Brassica cretica]|uniref:inositol oxygenase n=1 Tax=Brassica cretica TaxID=69181 RepID=A0A8S9HPA8_BRACR|nr:hypothetical protein F2Q68_00013392 [Brassica cretica]